MGDEAFIQLASREAKRTSGLVFRGKCDSDMTPSTTALDIVELSKFGDDFFNDAYYAQVIKNANSIGNVPEGEIEKITNYVSATGDFTCDAFTVNVEPGDEILILHESIIYNQVLTPAAITGINTKLGTPADTDVSTDIANVQDTIDISAAGAFGSWVFGGSGVDGAKTVAADENLAKDIYNYTSLTINTTKILGCSDSDNAFLVLLVQGDVTLGENANINMDEKGALGVYKQTGYQGGFPFGTQAKEAVATCLGGAGGGGGSSNGIAGRNGGGAGGEGGIGGVSNGNGNNGVVIDVYKNMVLSLGNKDTLFESFGAGGGSAARNNSGAGGNGGGFLYIECNNLILGTNATISADGEDGEDCVDEAAGAGGGGGVIIIRCKTFSGTSANVTALGGGGGISTNWGDGGNGATGFVLIVR